jgi:hypothetical protein
MLADRFPGSTPAEFDAAHGYAYGGAIIQDMGYYPFSSRFFSDLTHYVRSGDFVSALILESQDLNEYAFALGALSHYAADNSGHRLATNLAVPILYPQLRARFGRTVTYWDSPLSHVRTEFGFDVLQVAQGRYASDAYRAFIGFEVPKPLLERAFRDTYGIELKDIFGNLDLALGTFRYSVSSLVPAMTKIAWRLRKETLIKEIPGVTRKKFLFTLSRSSYQKQWGASYRRPGLGSRLLAFLLRLIPKSGPFASLAFRAPTPEVERLFMASFNATVDNYRILLARLDIGEVKMGNENFDTGMPTLAGQYVGADLTYDKLLHKLAAAHFAGVSPELRSNVLGYYRDRKPPLPGAGRKALRAWNKLAAERAGLEAFQPEIAAAP